MATPARGRISISEVTELATEVFEDSTYALEWLNESNIALDNRKPAEVMNSPDGVEVVKNLLLRIQYGVFA